MSNSKLQADIHACPTMSAIRQGSNGVSSCHKHRVEGGSLTFGMVTSTTECDLMCHHEVKGSPEGEALGISVEAGGGRQGDVHWRQWRIVGFYCTRSKG
jgi:hypothetical protein